MLDSMYWKYAKPVRIIGLLCKFQVYSFTSAHAAIFLKGSHIRRVIESLRLREILYRYRKRSSPIEIRSWHFGFYPYFSIPPSRTICENSYSSDPAFYEKTNPDWTPKRRLQNSNSRWATNATNRQTFCFSLVEHVLGYNTRRPD